MKKYVKKFSKKRYFFVIIIALFVATILSLLYSSGLFSGWQYKLSDTLYTEKPPLEDVVIVAIDDRSIQSIGRWPWNRSVFAKAIDNLDGSKLIAIDVGFFEPSDKENDKTLADAIKKAGNVILAAEYTEFKKEGEEIVGEGLLEPIPELKSATSSFGYVNIITDDDGITRGIYLGVKGRYKSFPEEIYSKYIGKELKYSRGKMLINFIGKPGTFKTISFVDVFNGNINRSFIEGKSFFIGATAPDLHDSYFVPTSEGEAMPGVEIHANTLQTLVTKDFLRKQNDSQVIISIFFVAIIVAALMISLRIFLSAIFSVVLFILYFSVAIISFSKGVVLNLIYPVLSIFFSYLAILGFYYLKEEKKKKEILDVFGRYVSRNVVDEIFKGDEVIDLKGVEKEITVLFSDIRGFTSLAEKLSPHEVVEMLNMYLGELTEIIFKYQGTLDKYMGDAIMAIYNAPIDVKEHELKACKTALEMQEVIEKLNKKQNKNLPKVHMGIGINSGIAVVGNIGSKTRVEYTAIGDTVNLGSRVEGLTKQYGVPIIITESIYKKIKNKLIARELDIVRVKGKNEPIRIYELRKEDYNKRWDKAILLYREQRFNEAKSIFEKIGDEASKVYIERCKELSKEKLPNNWDGVFIAKAK